MSLFFFLFNGHLRSLDTFSSSCRQRPYIVTLFWIGQQEGGVGPCSSTQYRALALGDYLPDKEDTVGPVPQATFRWTPCGPSWSGLSRCLSGRRTILNRYAHSHLANAIFLSKKDYENYLGLFGHYLNDFSSVYFCVGKKRRNEFFGLFPPNYWLT